MNLFFLTNASKTCMAVTFTVFVLVLGASVQGDAYDRIDNTAKKIQKKSRLLTKETVRYRNTLQYASLVYATSRLHAAASHVHKVAHFENNLNHLQADLADLDRCFHQLEGLFAATEDSAGRGRGHIHGNTGRVKSLLRSIERSIDQMRREVRKIQNRSVASYHEAHRTPVPVAHSTVHYGYSQPIVVPSKAIQQYHPVQLQRNNGFSFSIGGGSSRIHLKF